MINTTDHVAFILDGIPLHDAVVESIQRTIEILEVQFGERNNIANQTQFGFSRLLGSYNKPEKIRYDAQFIKTIYDLSQTASGGKVKEFIDKLIPHIKSYNLSKAGINSLKRGTKLMLVSLWNQGAILLPVNFSQGPHFGIEFFYDHELLAWLEKFKPETNGDGKEVATPGPDINSTHSEKITNTRRLYYYGPRLLYAASWRRPEDFDLYEMSDIHRAAILYAAGKSKTIISPGHQLPFSFLPAFLLHDFSDRVNFDQNDLKRYSHWILTNQSGEMPFDDFYLEKHEKLRVDRKKETEQTKKGKAKVVAIKFDVDQAENPHEALKSEWSRLSFKHRKEWDWRVGTPIYPGREHVNVAEISALWIKTFNAWLYNRKTVKGYRNERDAVSTLNVLADYIFFYLPWWKELSPESPIQIPSRPRDFKRYQFVSRDHEHPATDLPSTIIELIQARRAKASTGIALRHLHGFFSFVETQYADHEEIAGPGFKNPIHQTFDIPKTKKYSKTNKVPFSRSVYGFLLHWCYAVESFGIHLQELALQNKIPAAGHLPRQKRFDCAQFGQVPLLNYRGQQIFVDSVPNVFGWYDREVKDKNTGEVRTVFMPHLSALRLMIAAIETGLRCQSLQWLDRDMWCSKANSASYQKDEITYPVIINTDKVKTEPWTTWVIRRAYELLWRENKFQAHFADADKFGAVIYENLKPENQPFAPIRPLFRAPFSGFPISDSNYSNEWTRLMVDFEGFYRKATGETHNQFYRLQPRRHNDGTPKISYTNDNEHRPYVAISILPISTPHACRATFATNRKGLMELSDVADTIGHTTPKVTAHYTKPTAEDLRNELQKSDAILLAEWQQFDAFSGSHTRPDMPDSPLVQSFKNNRAGTVKYFKFIPAVALWSLEDDPLEEDGMQLLMEGPMSRIRFRDTHICPVGEECPADILAHIGAPKRCGCCPLSMKCLEHLPPISAKIRLLEERVHFQSRRRERLRVAGEPTAVLDEIWEEMQLDTNEMVGWKLCETFLIDLKEKTQAEDQNSTTLYLERPEVVRRHLQTITRSCSTAEFLLQRIADANAYPSMSSPQVEKAALRMKRKILGLKDDGSLEDWDDEVENIRSVAQMLSLMMKTSGVSMKDVAEKLAAPDAAENKLLPGGDHNGA